MGFYEKKNQLEEKIIDLILKVLNIVDYKATLSDFLLSIPFKVI